MKRNFEKIEHSVTLAQTTKAQKRERGKKVYPKRAIHKGCAVLEDGVIQRARRQMSSGEQSRHKQKPAKRNTLFICLIHSCTTTVNHFTAAADSCWKVSDNNNTHRSKQASQWLYWQLSTKGLNTASCWIWASVAENRIRRRRKRKGLPPTWHTGTKPLNRQPVSQIKCRVRW